jgi:hypothetical protein
MIELFVMLIDHLFNLNIIYFIDDIYIQYFILFVSYVIIFIFTI